jgi:hypothetical protein
LFVTSTKSLNVKSIAAGELAVGAIVATKTNAAPASAISGIAYTRYRTLLLLASFLVLERAKPTAHYNPSQSTVLVFPQNHQPNSPKTYIIGNPNNSHQHRKQHRVRRIHHLLIILLITSSTFYMIPTIVPYAHSTTTGLVCIAKNGSTSCPVSPPLINSTSSFPPPLRVAVVVNASDGLDAFDITLFASSTVLKPWKIDLTNTVLIGTPVLFLDCIGGVLKSTAGTCAPTDTVDTIHLSASSALGSANTKPPTTGLLFTAIYNVTSSVVSTPITFQTGCTKTSLSNVCVTIANGTPTPNPERIQTARFSDSPYFDLQTWFGLGSVTVAKGDAYTNLFLNATIVNGFSGTVTLTGVVTGAVPLPTLTGLPKNVMINSTKPFSAAFNCCQVNVTVGASVSPGNYNITFTGTSGSLPANTLIVPLFVPTPDIGISSNAASVTFNVTASGTDTIIVSSIANFAGTVNVTLGVPTGLNSSFTNGQQKTQIGLTANAIKSATVRFNSTIYGSYVVNVTASSGQIAHTITVTVNVADFTMFVTSPGPLSVPIGTTIPREVDFTGSLFPYTVIVNLAKIYVTEFTSNGPLSPSAGISVSCNPTTLLVTNTTSTETITPSLCSVTGNRVGNYTVTVVAVGGKATHALTFSVLVQGPDFTLRSTTSVQQVSTGGSATFSIIVAATKQGYNANVTLTGAYIGTPTSPPTVTITPVKILLNSANINGTSFVTITTSDSTPTGTYFLIISAHPHSLTIAIVVSTTASPHNLQVYSVTPSTTSGTVGSSISMTIVVQNIGRATENATVIAIAGDQNVAKTNITNIAPGQNVTVTLNWDTSGWTPGAYMVGAKVLGYNLLRNATPVTLNAANTSVLTSPYFAPSIIAALIVIVAIVSFLFLQTRRKTPSQQAQPSNP